MASVSDLFEAIRRRYGYFKRWLAVAPFRIRYRRAMRRRLKRSGIRENKRPFWLWNWLWSRLWSVLRIPQKRDKGYVAVITHFQDLEAVNADIYRL